ncbi:MAG: TOPRIM nucleotidyl transferase/hydrolase domain-containing protein [Pseudomonadota bacterium]
MAERSHLVRMHVKNIGCIGNDGLTVELDEIVCLVGPNNAGKTTVLRAYEFAVNSAELKAEDFNRNAEGNPASIELWVHIPKAAANVDEKWKEEKDGLLLVRSKWVWEWPTTEIKSVKPVRTTWDPSANEGNGEYAEDGKASGLDNVFKSRLPKPFRIGSLDNPSEEHKKLLTLVLEPVERKFKSLMEDKESSLSKKISELQTEAEKPVAEFKDQLEKIQSQVNSSYQQVFNSAEIRLTVSLGDIGFDPQKSLAGASRVDIAEKDGQARWDQQGTGSQRALFWSMLQVRSELNRLSDIRKGVEKDKAELAKLELKVKKTKPDETKIASLKEKLEKTGGNGPADAKDIEDDFLPGYMLLIDEPETALHPAAVRAAKDHLYALAAESGWQVMLSTHHPAFIDPLKDHTTIVRLHRVEAHLPPNIYRTEGIDFDGEEIENLKALLLFDANVAEMFFGGNVLIVEGDTEFAAFHEAMRLNEALYPVDQRPLIVRARGKATIAILIKMLSHFKIDFSVLHDIDSPRTKDGTKASPAYSMNKKIADAIGDARLKGLQIAYRCSCPNFEQHHGMDLPSKDKPYESWRTVRDDVAIRDCVLGVLNTLLAPFDPANIAAEDGMNYEVQLKTWIKANDIADAPFQFV